MKMTEPRPIGGISTEYHGLRSKDISMWVLIRPYTIIMTKYLLNTILYVHASCYFNLFFLSFSNIVMFVCVEKVFL